MVSSVPGTTCYMSPPKNVCRHCQVSSKEKLPPSPWRALVQGSVSRLYVCTDLSLSTREGSEHFHNFLQKLHGFGQFFAGVQLWVARCSPMRGLRAHRPTTWLWQVRVLSHAQGWALLISGGVMEASAFPSISGEGPALFQSAQSHFHMNILALFQIQAL